MSSWLMSVLRTAAQSLGGYLFAYLATHGVNIPVEAQSWVVQTLLVGAGVAVYTAAVRWLETRKGDGLLARGARTVAKLLMFGLSKQPVYAGPSQTVHVDGVLKQ
jgi:hypothetical protein